MTPKQVKTLLDSGVLQAYAEGKEIQWTDEFQGKGNWITYNPDGNESSQPSFGYRVQNTEWRIKPEKKTGWINIYPPADNRFFDEYPTRVAGNAGGVYSDREMADKANKLNGDDRIACIQITYEEGEGL